MSLFSTNRFKNLSAEYVEESLKVQKETTEVKAVDDTECKESVDEAVDIDALLESLND